MNQNKQLGLLTLLLVAVLVVAVLGTSFSAVRPTQARQTDAQRKEKWEYCAIIYSTASGDNFGRWNGRAGIRYFDVNGSREEMMEVRLDKENYDFNAGREATARAIAKLGGEGWEMVGRESLKDETNRNFIYFKRLKQ